MANDKERDPGSSSAEIGKYLDILARDPKSRVFAPLAEAYRKAGLFDDAVATALEGLKIHPNYLGGRVALGRAYFEKQQYTEAAIEMEKVAKAAPDNIIAHRVLGQIADSRNDLPAAEKAFRMVLLLDPRDLEARQFLESLKGAVQPPPLAPPAPAPAPAPMPVLFDEIQGIEDIELQAEEIVAPPPARPEPPLPLPSPAPPTVLAPIWPAPPPPPPPVPKSAPPSSPAAPPPPAPVAPAPPLRSTPLPAAPIWPAPPPPPSSPTPTPRATPPPTPPPRPASPPPQPSAPLWPSPPPLATAPATPPAVVAAEEPQSLFEQFSREPGPRTAPAPARVERGVGTGAREMDLETTAYSLPDTDIPAAVAAPVPTHIDSLAHEYPDEELPLTDPSRETRVDSLAQEYEEIEEQEQEPAPAAGRGVFDTETLAAIYIKQGFYGRAAEIYRRLLAQSPTDEGLRGKLKGVLDLQRREAGGEGPIAEVAFEEPIAAVEEIAFEEPIAAVEEIAFEEPIAAVEAPIAEVEEVAFEEPFAAVDASFADFEEPAAAFEEPAAAVEELLDSGVRRNDGKAPIRTGQELTIHRLETLLATFKGGRPQ